MKEIWNLKKAKVNKLYFAKPTNQPTNQKPHNCMQIVFINIGIN